MHERGLFGQPGQAARFRQQGFVDNHGRPHMHQYATFMHITSSLWFRIEVDRHAPPQEQKARQGTFAEEAERAEEAKRATKSRGDGSPLALWAP